jgi:hypothetical protein
LVDFIAGLRPARGLRPGERVEDATSFLHGGRGFRRITLECSRRPGV